MKRKITSKVSAITRRKSSIVKTARRKRGKWSSWGKGGSPSSSWTSWSSDTKLKERKSPKVEIRKVEEKMPVSSKFISLDGDYPKAPPRTTEHEWNGHKYERWHDTMRRAEAEANAKSAFKKGYKVKITTSTDEGEQFWTVWRYLPAWG